uniref:Uncharacterized protein AlNc14C115G6495 n=1 Tax=Albugo laibachii Nc14 TaxID=890382 RepID=F0WIV8_9STRA|nr:conserved hypothetical protein [Albugo laibachii Nc14]|eukprot:CCA21204.1 conserved hypothetical protein [Albugo laibachii Nc14]
MGLFSQNPSCALSPSSVPGPPFHSQGLQESLIEYTSPALPALASKDPALSAHITPRVRSSVANTSNRTKNTRSNSHRIPKFLRSLYTILQTERADIVAWVENAELEPNSVTAFHILDMKRFEQEVLPKYFKHRKFASFQRQLNNFGFRKWTKTQSSGVCTFSHNCFPPDPMQNGMTRNSVREKWKQHGKEAGNVADEPFSSKKQYQHTESYQKRPSDPEIGTSTTLQLSTALYSSRATKRSRKTSRIARKDSTSQSALNFCTQGGSTDLKFRHSRSTAAASDQHPILANPSSHVISASMDVLSSHAVQSAGGLQEWTEFGVILEDPPFLKQFFSAVDASTMGYGNDLLTFSRDEVSNSRRDSCKRKAETYGANNQYSFLEDLESQESGMPSIISSKSVSYHDEPLTELSSRQIDGKSRFEACNPKHDEDSMNHYSDELILEKILFD